jgi:hypothetical protein
VQRNPPWDELGDLSIRARRGGAGGCVTALVAGVTIVPGAEHNSCFGLILIAAIVHEAGVLDRAPLRRERF